MKNGSGRADMSVIVVDYHQYVIGLLLQRALVTQLHLEDFHIVLCGTS